MNLFIGLEKRSWKNTSLSLSLSQKKENEINGSGEDLGGGFKIFDYMSKSVVVMEGGERFYGYSRKIELGYRNGGRKRWRVIVGNSNISMI